MGYAFAMVDILPARTNPHRSGVNQTLGRPNLLGAYASFAELEAACKVFCEEVNTRVHRVTRRAPTEMLAEERSRLHPVPAHPHTVAFGLTRTVPASMRSPGISAPPGIPEDD